MNYRKACRVLDLDEDIKHDMHVIKKRYHTLALMYHPDKNNDADAGQIFTEIKEAYNFLKKEPSDSGWMENIFCVCETHSMRIINSLDLHKFNIIYKLFKQYRHLIQFSIEFENFMEKRKIYMFSQGSLKERHENNNHHTSVYSQPSLSSPNKPPSDRETMILRPVLDDVIVDNVYKYNHNNNMFLIPLWHHEIEYDISGDLFVKIIPKLPSLNYWIDSNNNLHQRIEYKLSELWDCVLDKKYMEIFFGKKRFIFYPHDLELKPSQTWTWKKEGISMINYHNIYDVSQRADVVLHIFISGII